jgi:hypothetical protein
LDLLYEFAFTPEVFSSAVVADAMSATMLKEVLRGIQLNGVIANLHKSSWLKHVQEQRVPSLSPVVRDQVIRLLNLLEDRNRIVRHPKRVAGPPHTEDEWLALAIESHRRTAMLEIMGSSDVCARCTEGAVPVFPLQDVLDSQPWSSRRNTRTLRKNMSEFKQALRPVLRYARAVKLIDPYLSPHATRFTNTIELVLRVTGDRRHGQQMDARIDIHAGDPNHVRDEHRETAEQRLAAWKRTLQGIGVAPHRVRVFLWKTYDGGENMHDRFILTDQIGISVPGGLDCRTGAANTTTWSRLDFDDQQFWAARFDAAANTYELIPPSPVEIR